MTRLPRWLTVTVEPLGYVIAEYVYQDDLVVHYRALPPVFSSVSEARRVLTGLYAQEELEC